MGISCRAVYAGVDRVGSRLFRVYPSHSPQSGYEFRKNNVAGRRCCKILRTDREGSVEEPEGRALENRSRLVGSILSECWMKWIRRMCVSPLR